MSAESRYANTGVDTAAADTAVAALVDVLSTIHTGLPRRSVVTPGHYANVIALDDRTGIAISTDGVGTKVLVAQQLGVFDTIGIDCIAMNVNDVICVGARPLALVDYIAVEAADDEILRQIAVGLKRGAEEAQIEIPGGELAQLPEIIRGAPSPRGLDLVGTCIGRVDLDAITTGSRIDAGDAILGIPSSGVHSNGLTLARHALLQQGGYSLNDRIDELGRTVGEELLEPTRIYVRAVSGLCDSQVDVRGLAHITSGGMNNLLRLNRSVGYKISDPMPVPPIFDMIREAGDVSDAEMAEIFNMGTGFCCIVPTSDADEAERLLAQYHPGARRIGAVGGTAGSVRVA